MLKDLGARVMDADTVLDPPVAELRFSVRCTVWKHYVTDVRVCVSCLQDACGRVSDNGEVLLSPTHVCSRCCMCSCSIGRGRREPRDGLAFDFRPCAVRPVLLNVVDVVDPDVRGLVDESLDQLLFRDASGEDGLPRLGVGARAGRADRTAAQAVRVVRQGGLRPRGTRPIWVTATLFLLRHWRG